ncbi:hypothetical protein [Streptomyces purpureus]|uniref:Membrane protein n=1 Tax=Streptomyces purpureus TaxID=1951 RepID=A0A918GY17_9ACTN|nr:hypothetical protein [Streptomyces purpureus]GGT17109.1 membrane protein [Streptomyces purpureus]
MHQTLSETARPPKAAPAPQRGSSPAVPAAGPRWRPGWTRAAGVALGVYAGAAALHLFALVLLDKPGGPGLMDRLVAWDGGLYVSIAEDGYPKGFTYGPDGELTGNTLAFFPLYPLLVRAVAATTGMGAATAAVVTAHLCCASALFAVLRLMTRLYGSRTATITVILLAAAQPMAVVFFMGYSEALFLALAAATLLAAHRQAWISAGISALLSGLTRPAALAVVLAVAVAAVLHMKREARPAARPLIAVALACLGTPAYLLWVGNRLGRLDGWFVVQEAGWGTAWDNGAATLDFLATAALEEGGWVPVSTALLLIALTVATAMTWQRRQVTWPPLLVYGTAMLVITLGQSNFYHSKLRLLIPTLLFLVPAARALARANRRTAITVLTGATLFGCWYGAHMVTVWRYAI